MRYDAVIFDSDGTLVDSEPIAHRVLSKYLTELGYPTTIEESYRDFLGNAGHNVRAVVAERFGGELPEDFELRCRERVFTAFRSELTASEGAEEILEALRGRGVPYAVASSSAREWILLSLGLTGLREQLAEDRIVSAEDVGGVGKPAPDVFLHTAKVLGVAAERCLVVEDSPNGVLAARAAGMDVYGYTALTDPARLAAAGATGLIGGLREVLELLDRDGGPAL
jgi:HAD superfamily hydrolase (TIGR01509 family)